MSNATRYPLSWPVGTPRTPSAQRKRSAFGKRDWDTTISDLHRELRLLDVPKVTVSTNQPIRNDGMPYAQERRIDDPGVAVYFTLNGLGVCFPCDRWLTIAENLRAVTMHLEAMRGMERWGVGKSNQAFMGYKALPASTEEDWWDVLECRRDASAEVVQTQYKARARAAHPDSPSGSEQAMRRLNTARDRALVEIGGPQ